MSEIEEYIKEQKKRGVSEQQIHKALVSAGYHPDEFKHHLTKKEEKLENEKIAAKNNTSNNINKPVTQITINHILLLNLFIILAFGLLIGFLTFNFNSKINDLKSENQNTINTINAQLEDQSTLTSNKLLQQTQSINTKFTSFDRKLSTLENNLKGEIQSVGNEALERDSALSGSIQGVKSESLNTITELGNKIQKVEDSTVDFTPVVPKAINSVVTIGKKDGVVFKSYGAGVIINSFGHIVTNYHVVDDINSISVKHQNGNTYSATLVDKDEDWDIALLKLVTEKKNFEYLDFANSNNVFVGQHIIAVGNPAGFDSTVTEGIISNTRRLVLNEPGKYFFQTDVAINPGNSGGPLIDKNGKIVGMVTLKYIGDNSEGLAFALKANDVQGIALDMLQNN